MTQESASPSEAPSPWIARLRTLLLILLIFLFGAVSGLGGGALFMKHRLQGVFRNPDQMNQPGERILARAGNKLKRELKLTEAQHQAVTRELELTHQNLQQIRRDAIGEIRRTIRDNSQRIEDCLPQDKHATLQELLRDQLEPWGMAP